MGTLGKVSLVASVPVRKAFYAFRPRANLVPRVSFSHPLAARKMEREGKHRHCFVYVQLSDRETEVHVTRMHVKII